MSDYTSTYGGAAKDSAQATILAADIDAQFSLISAMSATKANKVIGAVSGDILKVDANGDLVDSGVAIGGLTTADITKLHSLTATAAELNYCDGVTSNIQTQLDGKQDTNSILTTLINLAKTDGNFIVGNGSTWVAESGATARASLGLGSVATLSSIAASYLASTSNERTWINNLVAGSSAGGVGTFAFCYNASGVEILVGGTVAGSNLRYTGIDVSGITRSNGTPSGTWRCMGYAYHYSSTDASTLFLRIS